MSSIFSATQRLSVALIKSVNLARTDSVNQSVCMICLAADWLLLFLLLLISQGKKHCFCFNVFSLLLLSLSYLLFV